MISRKKQLLTLVAWILIVPPSVYFAFNYLPAREIDWVNIMLYLAIIFVTMVMPLHLPKMTVTLEHWITFVVFLQYGIFAELVISQIAMIILLLSSKSSVPTSHRFLVNSTLFTIVSIVSGLIFHLLGGEVGMLSLSSVALLGSIYVVTYMVLNSILLKLYFIWIGNSTALWGKGALWDYVITLIILPFSISLYYLNVYYDNKSIVLIVVPYLITLYVLRMYHRSDNLTAVLSSASVIGRELADRLGYEDVIRTFLVKLRDVITHDQAYVLDLREGKHLIMLMGSENGVVSRRVNDLVFTSRIFLGNGLDLHATKIFKSKKETSLLKNFKFAYSVESVMTVPIKRNLRAEGFLILTSSRKNAFQALDMKIVAVLSNYFSISLVKARLYEKNVEQSERCALTNLHNFRYLDAKLDEEMIRYHQGDIHSLSAIILDIDHFKWMNDTYGHQSGNDLLCELSTILMTYVDPDVTLARYGGEEFVFILPNRGKDEIIELAEDIRAEVAATTFRIIPDLLEDRSPIDVQMTVSIGVATVPEDADDAKLLLRNADRALYVGGKQAGRNRVGVFAKKEIVTV
ncbi:GGDEF domain-containing protein [Sporosarcina sp. NPDC096371]|uniref:GGDEF domain-containing protein n=1 Tax=Sporosarcina sp. NPDC096371 TaxID=3364530 RepID=UPI00380C908B